MILLNDPKDVPFGPKVVAIGSFDGVHLGHQALLSRALAIARERKVPLLVFTFDPPAKVLTQGAKVLTTLSEKAALLARQGADIVLALPFNEELAKRSKEEFLAELGELEPTAIVVGEDFRFGRGREGGPEDLEKLAPTVVLPLLKVAGEPVKSSRIRELVARGEVKRAQTLLGRPYQASGVVARGEGRGRRLGFPTANLAVPRGKALPPGVYAVWVRHRGEELPGVANVGTRPTFGGGPERVEVHILSPVGDLYGEELTVSFVEKIRDERPFKDQAELVSQIKRDIEEARRALALG